MLHGKVWPCHDGRDPLDLYGRSRRGLVIHIEGHGTTRRLAEGAFLFDDPTMKYLAALAVVALVVGTRPAGASPIVSVTGVVLGGQPSTKTLFIADSRGRVFLILAPRFVSVGTVVRVRGERSAPSWTIVASGSDGRLTRTGTALRAVVHGDLGFVDIARRHFQLAAHGQIVGDVSFPARFGPALQRLGIGPPQPRSLTFRLSIHSGRLSLAYLPH